MNKILRYLWRTQKSEITLRKETDFSITISMMQIEKETPKIEKPNGFSYICWINFGLLVISEA